MLCLLLQHGADVDVKNKYGLTPLMWAANNGHSDIASLLLQHGANIEAKDEDGRTPLMYASSWGHTDTASLLLQHGADIDVTDYEGASAIHRASPRVLMLFKRYLYQRALKNSFTRKVEPTAAPARRAAVSPTTRSRPWSAAFRAPR